MDYSGGSNTNEISNMNGNLDEHTPEITESFHIENDVDHISKRRKKRIARRKKRRAEKGGIFKRIAKGLKKVGKVVTTPLRLGALGLILPFKKTMRKALERKGITPSKKFRTLTEQFYNNVVKKSSNFAGDLYHESEVHFDEIVDQDNVAVAVGAVVSAIVSFFKEIKSKKDQGEPLTESETKIAKGVERVEKELEQKAKQEVAQEVGSKILFDKRWKIGLSVVGIIILGLLIWAIRK